MLNDCQNYPIRKELARVKEIEKYNRVIKMHHRLTDNLNSATFEEYRETVLTALREKAEREAPPKPLTLEELREREGKPVFIKHMSGKWKFNGWHIWDRSLELYGCENYGITWLAYDRETKEGE